jgi:hypothetical protein
MKEHSVTSHICLLDRRYLCSYIKEFGLHSSTVLPYIVKAQQDGFELLIAPFDDICLRASFSVWLIESYIYVYCIFQSNDFWKMVLHQIDPQQFAIVAYDAYFYLYKYLVSMEIGVFHP